MFTFIFRIMIFTCRLMGKTIYVLLSDIHIIFETFIAIFTVIISSHFSVQNEKAIVYINLMRSFARMAEMTFEMSNSGTTCAVK